MCALSKHFAPLRPMQILGFFNLLLMGVLKDCKTIYGVGLILPELDYLCLICIIIQFNTR